MTFTGAFVVGGDVTFGFGATVVVGAAVVVVGAAVVVVVGAAVVVVVASGSSAGAPNAPLSTAFEMAVAKAVGVTSDSAVRAAPRVALPSAVRSAAANCADSGFSVAVPTSSRTSAASKAPLPTRAGRNRRNRLRTVLDNRTCLRWVWVTRHEPLRVCSCQWVEHPAPCRPPKSNDAGESGEIDRPEIYASFLFSICRYSLGK